MVLPEAWVEINQVKKKLGAGKWAWCKAQGYGCKKRRWVESRAWSHKEHIFYQRDLIDPFLPSRDVWIPVRIMKGALRPLLSLTRLAHDFSFYLNDSHKKKKLRGPSLGLKAQLQRNKKDCSFSPPTVDPGGEEGSQIPWAQQKRQLS